MAFGIFWYYLAHAVESSLHPLPMIITEYRAYLPGAGVLVSATVAGVYGFGVLTNRVPALRGRGGISC